MSTTHNDLQGHVAVVSGAGSGIGEGLARHAATAYGMKVVVADVALDRAEAVAAGIRETGGQAKALSVDVSDYDSVASLVESVRSTFGSPAFLACNAGIEMTGLLWETEPRAWERVQGINVNGAFNLMHAFLPGMLERGARGHVLCTSSIGGLGFGANQSAYTVSKHAIRVLAQSLEADLDSVGADIGVSILLPGPVKTRIFDDAMSTGSAEAKQYRAQLGAYLAGEGLSSESVARLTYDQITSGAKWIYPHPEQARPLVDAMVAEFGSVFTRSPATS